MEAAAVQRLLARHEGPVPRYTSYPTAPHFEAGRGSGVLGQIVSALDPGEPVSLYLHIPFCDRLCWFCGCNTKHTLKYEPVQAYVGSLLAEIAMMARVLGTRSGGRQKVARIHLGGGSPSMLSAADMGRLGDALRSQFALTPDCEISVEIDPSDVTAQTMEGLAAIGVTRGSIGVQDFDPAVQKSINRPQSFELTRDVIGALRSMGVKSVNIDALYGLPLQDTARLTATIDKVISLAPDRVALFGYAHVPWLKKHQQMIRDDDLPGPFERFLQAQTAGGLLTAAGYDAIGIDHFAKPDDQLAIAAANGHLRRNFQGYTTDDCTTLIGLGGSAISSHDIGFVQNIVPTGQYREAVDAGKSAASRGLFRSLDDRVRGWIIERLMCEFAWRFDDLLDRFGNSALPYCEEARAIAMAERDGLCSVDRGAFLISDGLNRA